tara:strand:- start:172 stop:1017 length:846 start_codon:yes stop_codon:yes gene_type:complete
MNKEKYLSQDIIKDFTEWVSPKISEKNKFNHKYYNAKTRTIWECDSIYNAFENYEWQFNCSIPNLGKIKGKTYLESKSALETIQKGLKKSIEENDSEKSLKYSISILEWGGVTRSNSDKLKLMGKEILIYYKNSMKILNPEKVNLNNDFSEIIMNSGFTKIYSLLVDNFVIYDSRVGAALGLLIKEFLTEKHILKIPNELNFAYGNARPSKGDDSNQNKRNPSTDIYKFSALRNNDKHHTLNNLKANWLLKEIADKSKFDQEETPVRSLEAALFMIGYSVN